MVGESNRKLTSIYTLWISFLVHPTNSFFWFNTCGFCLLTFNKTCEVAVFYLENAEMCGLIW